MLFLPLTFVVALMLVALKILTHSKVRPWDTLARIYLKLHQSLTTLIAKDTQTRHQPVSGRPPETSKNSPKPGILKQVHFAEVIAISSTDGPTKQSNTHSSITSSKHCAKEGNKSKSYKSHAKNGNAKKGNSIPQIEDFDIDALIEATPNYSVISKANLIKKQHQQHLENKRLGRKRHNSEGSRLSYSSEQLFKIIAASCLSKEEVELAVETLLNKVESGEAQWNQPKNDPLFKLKNQLRETETALTTETHNHEQARARLVELKTQLKNETNFKLKAVEEVSSLRKEVNFINTALEKARSDLTHQREAQQRADEERIQLIEKLEQENGQLKSLLASNLSADDEAQRIRHELGDKLEQVNQLEIANQNLSRAKQELEARLRNGQAHLSELENKRRSGEYEARARISELEADRGALENALKDHMSRLNEVIAANTVLEKSLNDARVLNNQQGDVIRRLEEKTRLDEASMQRALCEMEAELRVLHEQLSSKTSTKDERHRTELNQFEKELNDAGQREQKLTDKMKQLRDGLAELFPDLNANLVHNNSDDWVRHYLMALKQLTVTVDELRGRNNNNQNGVKNHNSSEHSNQSTPSKRSSLNLHTNGKSSRVGSPTSNGRASRASSNLDRDKKTMEKRLAETTGSQPIIVSDLYRRIHRAASCYHTHIQAPQYGCRIGK